MKMERNLRRRGALRIALGAALAVMLLFVGCGGVDKGSDAGGAEAAVEANAAEEESGGGTGTESANAAEGESTGGTEAEIANAVGGESDEEKVAAVVDAAEGESAGSAEKNVLGEGSREFLFTVADMDGNETTFEIHTDKETVGEALQELGLIDGDESQYGLYVKVVNGVTADFDTDGVYWAFYINGEYAASGVDSTPIADGESYSFKIEKG
ncbi:MAG: DUF4430 domain-containing protein [Clostridium sp.]|nr:DUF4430 domain-containing protein [Clostridium sp.]